MKERMLFLLINKVFSLFDTLLKVGLPVYAVVEVMPYLAGETTIVSMIFSKASTSNMLPWVLTGVSLLWAISERKLRYNKTVKLSKRIQKLETKLDPNRSSSGLDETGVTAPKDKI